MKLHVRRDDKVVVVSGKDKGKIGEVISVQPRTGKIVVKDVNVVTKHQKPSRQNMQGGMVQMEAPIYSSKVMLYCDKCKKATRISKKILEDGTKVRICKHCGETI